MYIDDEIRQGVISIVVFVICIVLTGISLGFLENMGSAITSGEVIKKKHTPAKTEVQMIPWVMTDGETATYNLFPYRYNYADKWEITIRDYDEQTKQYLTATYRVTEQVYNKVQIGSQFEYKEDMAPTEPEYTRERQPEESSFEQSYMPN